MAYNVDLAMRLLELMELPRLPFEGLPALEMPSEWKSPKTGADLLIVASNGGSALNWPMSRYLDWARSAMDQGKTVQFLIHGTDAAERRRDLEKSDIASRAECLPSFAELSQLIAHIASCGEIFSSSTGPLHIAHALGRPVTGLYPVSPKVQSFERWRPDGYWHEAPVKWISIS
jgi:ADP-heptose:LPS heptosyltransferase